jgi:1-acyl-sn-glycerol-3-phosphate acyltransferase
MSGARFDPDRFDPDRLDARDPVAIRALLPLVRTLNRRYVRLRVEGFTALPRDPVLFVANHSGGFADPSICCTLGTLWEARGPEAPLYALAHDFAMQHFPPFGRAIQRYGALRASPSNARAALARGASVLVYPGGDLEAYRASRRRDEIVLGSRLGFVRLAQESGVPIVPIVAQGAHRSAYIISEGAWLSQLVRLKQWSRLERFPLALALPWGLAVGPWLPYLPLPFSIQLRALAPISAPPDAEPRQIHERVRCAMQAALDELAARARAERDG